MSVPPDDSSESDPPTPSTPAARVDAATAVRLQDVVALIGRFPALAGVDLSVATGEILLLRGPNGAGKTTLLRVCAGLVPVTSGAATVLGVDVAAHASLIRRRVGLLGHDTYLYDDLTTMENVTFWTRAAGGVAADGRAALDRVRVASRLHGLPVRALSAGQRRRVALAVLIARRPELWLLDEPHAGLDPDGRDLVDGLMREAARAGATVVFASHELDRAGAVAHRDVLIAGGRVLADPEAPTAAAEGTDG
ncbi:MAG: heme ABC exporter ATP-binding protein CcmA [Actinomycetes bacterium]